MFLWCTGGSISADGKSGAACKDSLQDQEVAMAADSEAQRRPVTGRSALCKDPIQFCPVDGVGGAAIRSSQSATGATEEADSREQRRLGHNKALQSATAISKGVLQI
jgi:hypothetical protein